MNYTQAIQALLSGSIITRTSFTCKREYSINPNNNNEFIINGNIGNSTNIAILETQSQETDWVIVNA